MLIRKVVRKIVRKVLRRKIVMDIINFPENHSTPLTDKDKLKSLIHKLRPVSSGKRLIRLGPNGDGGYLVPDDLKEIEACFSPGVDYVSGFEKVCADMGMKVFLADKSVARPAESHEQFNFTMKNIGVTTNDEFMTIDEWVNTSVSESKKDLLLQIDIEGYEYETFLCMSDNLIRRFRVIVVEFHQLDMLWSQPFFQLVSRVFEKILQTHSCLHIHPNNCCGSDKRWGLEIPRVAEFTFLRNDRIKNPSFVDSFPNPLDYDNTSHPTLPLPKCWYKTI